MAQCTRKELSKPASSARGSNGVSFLGTGSTCVPLFLHTALLFAVKQRFIHRYHAATPSHWTGCRHRNRNLLLSIWPLNSSLTGYRSINLFTSSRSFSNSGYHEYTSRTTAIITEKSQPGRTAGLLMHATFPTGNRSIWPSWETILSARGRCRHGGSLPRPPPAFPQPAVNRRENSNTGVAVKYL